MLGGGFLLKMREKGRVLGRGGGGGPGQRCGEILAIGAPRFEIASDLRLAIWST